MSRSSPAVLAALSVCVAIIPIISGCQNHHSEDRPDEPPTFDFRQYFPHDEQCQTSPTVNHNGRIYLTGYDTDEDKVIAAASSDAVLRTSVISDTFYGLTYRRHCDNYVPQGEYCLDENYDPVLWESVPNVGDRLRICAPQEDYPENSFERVALTTAYHLQQTYAFFMASTAETLSPMTLSVIPFFETTFNVDYTVARKYLVDNILYFPTQRTLAILPQSRGSSAHKLWETPYVISHEFAHHAQYAVLETKERKSQAFTDYYLSATTETTPTHVSYNHKAITAFLEGWADVYAYYAEGETSGKLNTYCFGFNREVPNPYFANGTAKYVDRYKLTHYYDGQGSNSLPCEVPNFTDSHVIGAVFAHYMYRLVDYLSAVSTDASQSSSHKYRLLHDWLRSAMTLPHDNTEVDLFTAIIMHMFTQTQQFLDTTVLDHAQRALIEAEVCDLFEEGFPQLSGCRSE